MGAEGPSPETGNSSSASCGGRSQEAQVVRVQRHVVSLTDPLRRPVLNEEGEAREEPGHLGRSPCERPRACHSRRCCLLDCPPASVVSIKANRKKPKPTKQRNGILSCVIFFSLIVTADPGIEKALLCICSFIYYWAPTVCQEPGNSGERDRNPCHRELSACSQKALRPRVSVQTAAECSLLQAGRGRGADRGESLTCSLQIILCINPETTSALTCISMFTDGYNVTKLSSYSTNHKVAFCCC